LAWPTRRSRTASSDIETTRLIGQDIWRIVNQRRAEQAQRLAATVFSASTSAICITDADERIVCSQPGVDDDHGLRTATKSSAKRRGCFPPARQSDGFYREMWNRIAERRRLASGEIWKRRKNGEIFPAWLTITAVTGTLTAESHTTSAASTTSANASVRSAHPLPRAPRCADQTAQSPLLDDRIRRAIAKSRRDGTYTAVLFLDLDRFKLINDTLGHDTGDRCCTCRRAILSRVLRETETVARLGGDEFIIVVPDWPTSKAWRWREKVLAVVATAVDRRTAATRHAEHRHQRLSRRRRRRATLLRNADTAMYHAKERGRNNFQFFTPE
jgi:diguanylate cyclase (GGDEF)-like protein